MSLDLVIMGACSATLKREKHKQKGGKSGRIGAREIVSANCGYLIVEVNIIANARKNFLFKGLHSAGISGIL